MKAPNRFHYAMQISHLQPTIKSSFKHPVCLFKQLSFYQQVFV